MVDGKQRTILVAEDNPAAVLLIERAFRKGKLNFTLQIVGDGREAQNYLVGEAPYSDRDRYPLPVLVITNIKMPRMTGLELLGWLRQQPQFKDLPVVVISSSELDGDSNQAYQLGANSYLVKPVSTEALLAVLEQVNLGT